MRKHTEGMGERHWRPRSLEHMPVLRCLWLQPSLLSWPNDKRMEGAFYGFKVSVNGALQYAQHPTHPCLAPCLQPVLKDCKIFPKREGAVSTSLNQMLKWYWRRNRIIVIFNPSGEYSADLLLSDSSARVCLRSLLKCSSGFREQGK